MLAQQQNTFKKSIFTRDIRPRTLELSADLEIDIMQSVPFNNLFDVPCKKQDSNKIFGSAQEPVNLKSIKPVTKESGVFEPKKEKIESPKAELSEANKENRGVFKVFENKENRFSKPPQKLEISTMIESRAFSDYNQEISELRSLNVKYENKIDSLLAENIKLSNKLSEVKQVKNANLPNIEAKLESLLKENQKLTEVIKTQSLKIAEMDGTLKESEEEARRLAELVKGQGVRIKDYEGLIKEVEGLMKDKETELIGLRNELRAKDEMLKGQERKIEAFKREILKTNDEKSDILEEFMSLKLKRNNSESLQFNERVLGELHRSESELADLRKEVAQLKEENTRLNEKIQAESLKKSHEVSKKNEGNIRRKMENYYETFDNLAQLNEKLNVHLDAIQTKGGKKPDNMMRKSKVELPQEQAFQFLQKTHENE